MIKVNEKQYNALKERFDAKDKIFRFGSGTVSLLSDDNDEICRLFTGKKRRKALGEFALLLRFEDGDSFEQHFQIKDEKKHYWKTDSGLYLYSRDGSKIVSGVKDYIRGFEYFKYTKSEVEASDFDINKVKICDEEFK